MLLLLLKPVVTPKYDFVDEKYKSPAGILLHSRTVVEKKDFVSTGVLTYAEGDVVEVEIPEYGVFELGDAVKLTVYSPGGIYIFSSSVVAKDHGSLISLIRHSIRSDSRRNGKRPESMCCRAGIFYGETPV